MITRFYTLFIIIISFILICYLNLYVQKIGNEFYSSQDGKNRNAQVYDILHNLLPDKHEKGWLTNLIAIVSIIPLLLHFNVKFIFEYVGMLFTIFIFRAITINVTILPRHEKCDITEGFMTPFIGGCFDKIFSGHFAFVFMLSLLYYSYKYITNIPFLVGWNIMNALVIISTRSHYTIDIIVSALVCYIVYDDDLNFFKLLNK
jgi:hypothetical protein